MNINYYDSNPTELYIDGCRVSMYANTNLDKEEAVNLAQFIASAPTVLKYLQGELSQHYITERDKRIMRGKIETLLNLLK